MRNHRRLAGKARDRLAEHRFPPASDYDPGPSLGQRHGTAQADPRAATDDDGRFVVELVHEWNA
jgi:hypothetical protein